MLDDVPEQLRNSGLRRRAKALCRHLKNKNMQPKKQKKNIREDVLTEAAEMMSAVDPSCVNRRMTKKQWDSISDPDLGVDSQTNKLLGSLPEAGDIDDCIAKGDRIGWRSVRRSNKVNDSSWMMWDAIVRDEEEDEFLNGAVRQKDVARTDQILADTKPKAIAKPKSSIRL